MIFFPQINENVHCKTSEVEVRMSEEDLKKRLS